MEYLVAVTDHVSTYLYGPFKSKSLAHAWAAEYANAFHGRTVHIIPNRTINPTAD